MKISLKRTALSAIAICAVVVGVAACAGTQIQDAEPSIDALAQSVLDAVERRDLDRLQSLALSEEEFRGVVWPELPAARPERNLPVDFVWNDLRLKSATSLGHILDRYAQTPLALVDIRFNGGTTPYDSYLVHREAVLIVKGQDGTEQEVRLFGSVFEQDGRYKVFSYNVD